MEKPDIVIQYVKYIAIFPRECGLKFLYESIDTITYKNDVNGWYFPAGIPEKKFNFVTGWTYPCYGLDIKKIAWFYQSIATRLLAWYIKIVV